MEERGFGRFRRFAPRHGVRFRLLLGVAVAAVVVGRPARLESLRWWHSPNVVASLGLTGAQTRAIEDLYQQQLANRSRCVERSVAATNRIDVLIRQQAYDENLDREARSVLEATAEEARLMQNLDEGIARVLSSDQREILARLQLGRPVD